MNPADTSLLAQAAQVEAYRRMTGEERLLLALEMSLFARGMRESRIREEHPEWSDAQVALELLRLAFLPGPIPAGLR